MAGPIPLLGLLDELRDFANRRNMGQRMVGGGVRGAATRGLLGMDAPEDATPTEREVYENAARMSAPAQGLTALKAATVFHGTPHKFTKFDAKKIGTGEGAQAYGHGLYVAESPGVAKQYAENVKDMESVRKINEELSRLAKIMSADETGYRKYRTEAGRKAAAEYDDLIAQRDAVRTKPGNLYTIDLPDEAIARMLDWDKPLRQQPESVRIAVKDLSLPANATGKDIYNALATQARDVAIARGNNAATTLSGSQSAASADLRGFGIPGIRYLDQGSRGQGQGTSNFVVFPGEEELLRILERNGVPIQSLLD